MTGLIILLVGLFIATSAMAISELMKTSQIKSNKGMFMHYEDITQNE